MKTDSAPPASEGEFGQWHMGKRTVVQRGGQCDGRERAVPGEQPEPGQPAGDAPDGAPEGPDRRAGQDPGGGDPGSQPPDVDAVRGVAASHADAGRGVGKAPIGGGGSAAATQRRQVRELADRVARLEGALVEGLEELRKEQAGRWAQADKRLAALEAAGSNAATANTGTLAAGTGSVAVNGGAPTGGDPVRSQPGNQGAAPAVTPPVSRPRRVYPDLVTVEAEPGEELVYGDDATALIVQWREAWDVFNAATDAMDILNARERRLELEIELIEKHELTLPPATRPWDWGDRRQEVRRRNELLYDVTVDRKMLRLRRFLTLGLWRK